LIEMTAKVPKRIGALRCRLERNPASVRVLARTGTPYAIAIAIIRNRRWPATAAAQLRLQLLKFVRVTIASV